MDDLPPLLTGGVDDLAFAEVEAVAEMARDLQPHFISCLEVHRGSIVFGVAVVNFFSKVCVVQILLCFWLTFT